MKYFSFLLFISFFMACSQQTITKEQQAQLDKAKEAQNELNLQYADKEKSPLTDEDFKTFKGISKAFDGEISKPTTTASDIVTEILSVNDS